MLGDLLTRATIWLSLGGYTVSFCLQTRRHPGRIALAAWLFGATAFVLHTLFAFHFFYQWSHSVALAETARQTKELTGFDSGSGLYLNYAFGLIWLADAIWWLQVGDEYSRRPRWLTFSLHAFFWFMIVNGAIVFGTGPVRVFGIALVAAMLFALWGSARRNGDKSALA